MAEWTGLEPAPPGVTGRYSNQLNYHSSFMRRRVEHPIVAKGGMIYEIGGAFPVPPRVWNKYGRAAL
jgi:hypothetical protein